MADHVAPALEAILMVAEERFRQRCWPSWSVRRSTRLRRSARTWRPSTSPTDEDSSRSRCGGLSLPDRHRAGALRRTFRLDGQSARLSAALETLAVIAYKQPVSRNQIASIRGVNVDAVMRTLQQRGYVDEVARDPGPGQAVLYGTTPTFSRTRDRFTEDLPPLGEFFPEADVVEALERGLRAGSDDDELRTPSRPTLITVARTSEPRLHPEGAAAEDPGPSRVRSRRVCEESSLRAG